MSSDIGKKERYHKLYMDIAVRVGGMSHCERSKVGSVLIKEDRILSMGWNGTPTGFHNSCEIDTNTTKKEVVHSEVNLIAKIAASSDSSSGASVYLTLSPCFNCAKLLLRSAIKTVYILKEYRDLSGVYFLVNAGVDVILLNNSGCEIKSSSNYAFESSILQNLGKGN